ncbi:hypothetical protein ACFVXG_08165 [Kitasatospora sp. NPDC058162]|uniref:imidazolonepropionase-like domain-containing protein n=1 Tax=Kitasatospora sp. NPDC058162 TaxID=3346362 RepID=UPI0036DF299E
MLTLHRAEFLLPDPAGPTDPAGLTGSTALSFADGAVVVRGELVEAVGPYAELAAAHPSARVRDWGRALLAPGLRNPCGQRLLERDYHPDPREEIGVEPVVDGLVGCADETRYGASARRGLQRMLGYGVTAVAGPFARAAVRTAVARSGLVALPGAGGPLESGAGSLDPVVALDPLAVPMDPLVALDPLAVLPLARAVYGRVAAGGRADFAVFPVAVEEGGVRPVAGGCLATVLGGRLVYRRR